MNLQSKLEEAIRLQTNNPKKAKNLFLQILKRYPTEAASLYSLAAIEANERNYKAALRYASGAIEAKKDFPQAYLARAVIQSNLGDINASLRDIETALAMQPDLPGAADHKNKMLAIKAQGIETLTPEKAKAHTLNLDALRAQESNDYVSAKKLFHQVLEMDANNFVALYSLGVIASREGQLLYAVELLTQAAEAEPTNATAHFAMATSLQGLAQYEAALAAFDKAIELDPANTGNYSNKATLLHSMNRQHEAVKTLDQGLSVAPNDDKLLANKAYLLTEFKQNAWAATIFQQVLQINPDYEYAQGLLSLARLHSCDWTDYEPTRQRIIDGVRAGKRVCNPFAFLSISDSAADQRRCAEIFGEHRFPAAPVPMYKGEKYRHRKTRVAFISADFREHPVGYLLIGLIENFDKSRFETYGISLGIRDGSELYKRYRMAFDHYFDCADKTSYDVAQAMRALEIDIAIDLSGYTSGSRIDILAHRPAPAQMTYLGYPSGLSVPYIDYLIADPITVPDANRPHYQEKILHLPHCYLPRDTTVKPSPVTPKRSDFGLPEEGVVFCSFNHDYKINPPMFAVWMDLLREHPKSTLWLMKLNEDAQKNLAQSASDYGIDPSRLVFATRVPRIEDHLARYRLADVFLDASPYNGHTTASDALFSGLPVVTLTGNSFASRVATSLLNDYGRTEWCATTLEEYKNKVNDILRNPRPPMSKIREGIDGSGNPPDEKKQAEAFCQVLASIYQ